MAARGYVITSTGTNVGMTFVDNGFCPVDVLDCTITGNHVHRRLWTPSAADRLQAMRAFAGMELCARRQLPPQ